MFLALLLTVAISWPVFVVSHAIASARPSDSAAAGWAQGGLAVAALSTTAMFVVVFLGRSQAERALTSRGLPCPELALGVALVATGPRLIQTLRSRGALDSGTGEVKGDGLSLPAAAGVASQLHHRMVLSMVPFVLEIVVVLPALSYLLLTQPAWFTLADLDSIIIGSMVLVIVAELGLWATWRAADRSSAAT